MSSSRRRASARCAAWHPALSPHPLPLTLPRHAHRPCPVAVRRNAWPPPPVGAPHPPGSRHRASARCAAWHLAHPRRAPPLHPQKSRPLAVARSPPSPRAPSPCPVVRTAITPAHYPRGAMGTSRPTAITPKNSPRRPRPLAAAPMPRAPSETLKSPAVAHRLCAPIHPTPSLFVFLCVYNSRITRAARWLPSPAAPLVRPSPPRAAWR